MTEPEWRTELDLLDCKIIERDFMPSGFVMFMTPMVNGLPGECMMADTIKGILYGPFKWEAYWRGRDVMMRVEDSNATD